MNLKVKHTAKLNPSSTVYIPSKVKAYLDLKVGDLIQLTIEALPKPPEKIAEAG